MTDPRYPIGKFHFEGLPSEYQRKALINDIEQAPAALRAAVKDLSPQPEDRWARLADTQSTPIDVSLALLESLHTRWVRLLRSLTPDDWKKGFRHPVLGLVPLEKNLAIYAWHGKHHVAHVTELRKKMGW